MLFFNSASNKAYQLKLSLPFSFKQDAGIVRISEFRFLLAGGTDEGELVDDCMLLEASQLTGVKLSPLPVPTCSQTLLYSERHQKVYAVGGLMKKDIDENDDSEFVQGHFASFNLVKNEWESLAQMPELLCCPTCYLHGDKIYSAGGFRSLEGEMTPSDSIQVYDIQQATWTYSGLKFSLPTFKSIVHSFNDNILIFGGENLEGAHSGKAYILKDNQFQNLANNATDKQILAPAFPSKKAIYFNTESGFLLKFDIQTLEFTEQSINACLDEPNFEEIAKSLKPRDKSLNVYHSNINTMSLVSFNNLSEAKHSCQLSKIKYLDCGMATLPQGNLFFVGGYDPETYSTTNLCFMFDTATKQEFETPELPRNLRGIRLAVNSNLQYVYAVAGFDDSSPKVFNYVFSLTDKTWYEMNSEMENIRYPSVSIFKEDIYTFGGERLSNDGYEELVSIVQVYKTNTMKWSKLELTYEVPCKGMGILPLNASLMIFGGEDEEGNPFKASFEFDGKNLHKREELPGNSSVLEFNDPPCVRGDFGYIFSSCGDLYKLDLNTRFWEEIEIEEITNRV
mgnify:FL=1